jgi:predicted metal-binding membrane protein
MWPRVRDQKLFLTLITGLITLAWLGLWTWKQSPYGRFLSHQENEGVHSLGDQYLVLVTLFVAGWTLMTAAMMLPTSLPLVATFRAIVRSRVDRARLVTLLIVGYLAVWTLFAVFAHAGDLSVHRVVDHVGWLHANTWVIGAGTFVLAGLYQFTPLKYHCLDKCRSPMTFVMSHWRGRDEQRRAFWLGMHHGLFCLGCCWSLMLLMFVVGIGNIGWMLVLGAVMAVEKNMPWGRRLSAPLGVALVAIGLVLSVTQTSLGGAI